MSKKSKTHTVPFITLADNAPRVLSVPETPICFASTQQLRFSVWLPADPAPIRFVILSNRDDPARLQVDEEAMKVLQLFEIGEIMIGPATYGASYLTWKMTAFSSENHALPGRDAVIFSLALFCTKENKIISQTECFFVVTHSNRRKEGPFFEYLQKHISSLAKQFQFNIARNPEILHPCSDMVNLYNSCAELIRLHDDNIPSLLPACCLLGGGDVVHPRPASPNFDDLFGNNDDILSWSAPTHTGYQDINEALVEKVGDFWGRCGMDPKLGFFKVKVESEIAIQIFPKRNMTLTICLTDIDRVKHVFGPVQIASSQTSVLMPLRRPKPKELGVEMIDIIIDKQKPVTMVYMVNW